MKKLFCLLIFALLLTACTTQPYAPVVEGWRQAPAKQSRYLVQKGDTLYSIAFAFDTDYRQLAKINHLSPPYALRAGQHLNMGQAAARSVNKTYSSKTYQVAQKAVLPETNFAAIKGTRQVIPQPTPITAKPVLTKPSNNNQSWQWPSQGKIVGNFGYAGGKGIEIAGRLGQPVVASAPGKVVYSGAGLRGYGNLIIIKHNEAFLSAYAFNQQLLVKEGATVLGGQKIALMGKNTAGQIRLHFEIRRNGKPVDPLSYLKQ